MWGLLDARWKALECCAGTVAVKLRVVDTNQIASVI
jgi:hypothetical protein